jgi:hypothetical protein
MDRREREQILGVWGGRETSARARAAERRLREDLEGSPLKGRPLDARLRNFRPDVERYVASLGGPLPYMQRLRAIEDATQEHEERLEEAWRELAAASGADAAGFARRWRSLADRWSFYELNELIERHNRYFPAEARLPMDPKTGDFVPLAGRSYRRRMLDAAWILSRFPPSLRLAAAA